MEIIDVTKGVDIEDCELDDSTIVYDGRPFSGVLFSLHENGQLCEESEYQDGLPHGKCRLFFQSGALKREWHAHKGQAKGKLIEYFENGTHKLEEIREFGFVGCDPGDARHHR